MLRSVGNTTPTFRTTMLPPSSLHPEHGAPFWRNYTLGKRWDAATPSCSPVAALRHVGITVLLREFYVGMATPAPETSSGFLEVDPDVTEPLAVVTLCEDGLGFECSVLYNDFTEVGEGEEQGLGNCGH